MKFYEEYVSVNGIQQYFLHGIAPESDAVLLYLHGGPGFSAAYHAYLLDVPKPPCTLVFYDQRGAGKTFLKNRAAKPTFSILLEDLHYTIHYLKEKYHTERILLLGHSWGSVLGTQYVLQYPETVSAYIGMGQVINMLRGEAAAFAELKRRILAKNRPGDIRKCKRLEQRLSFRNFRAYKKSRRGLLLSQYRYGFYPKILTAVKNVWNSPVFSIKDILAFLISSPANQALEQFLWEYDAATASVYALPVYYILGKEDWQVPSTVAAQFFENIRAPRKKLFWIPSAGHSTAVDNPAAFWNAVEKILLQ